MRVGEGYIERQKEVRAGEGYIERQEGGGEGYIDRQEGGEGWGRVY